MYENPEASLSTSSSCSSERSRKPEKQSGSTQLERSGGGGGDLAFSQVRFNYEDPYSREGNEQSCGNCHKDASNESFKYPRAVAFIISNEFCERFNYYGMRAILVLYLTQKLGYNEETSTVLFHSFTMLVYIFPLMGAVIADGWLGKYKTILYLSMLYSVGAMTVAMGAIPLPGMPVKSVTIVGLLLIAIGTGGIKPCVSAFGGDQFQLPEQRAELAKFFSLFYFAINAGSMISTTVTPMLRADIHCFGENDCYSLAFGVPAVLMIFSMLIFVMGKRIYKIHPPAGNAIFGVSQTVTCAYKGWQQERGKRTVPFLDYATPSVGPQMVDETKCLFKILLLYVPFPMFWALADQQGSRWTFQAAHMDGSIGSFSIKPDQMQVINPLLILLFIPLFDYFVYPKLAQIGIRRPLQKLSLGLLLAAIGFFLSAMVEMRLEENAPSAFPHAADIAHLRIYNGMPCRYEFTSDLGSAAGGSPYEHSIEPLGMWSHLGLYAPAPAEYVFKAEPQAETKNCPNIEGRIVLEPGASTSYFLAQGALQKFSDGLKSSLAKRSKKPPLLRTLFNTPHGEGPIQLRASASSAPGVQLDSGNLSALHEISLGRGELDINGQRAASFEAKNGGLYSLLVEGNANDGYQYNMLQVVPITSVSMLWQLPQIVVMTAAEIMFSVTGLEFSFTQAPPSMKAVLQACWLLTVAIGNLIVVFIAKVKFVSSQSAEFALFATIMLINLVIFIFLSKNYMYIDHAHTHDQEQRGEASSQKCYRRAERPRCDCERRAFVGNRIFRSQINKKYPI